MKKINIFFWFIIFFFSFNPLFNVSGFKVWGIEAEDGTAIQIFYNDDGVDLRVPQDSDRLPFEDFYVYLDVRDESERSIHFNMFGAEKSSTATYNPDTQQYTFKNETTFTKYVGNYTMKMRRGQNDYGSNRFSLKRIDTGVWTDLKPSSEVTRIEVRYQNLVFSFMHQTDYSKIPLTKTIGFFNMEVIFNVIFLAGILVASVIAGSIVAKGVGGVFPKVNLSLLAFLITWFIIALILQMLTETKSTAETMRRLMVLDPQLISVFIGFLAFFWIPSKFRPESLSKTRLVSFNIPFLDIISILDDVKNGRVRPENQDLLKEPLCDWIDLFHYTDIKTNKIRYVRNPDSYWDFFSRVFFGHMKFDHKNTLVVPRKNGQDRMLLVSSLEHAKRNPINKDIRKTINITGFIGMIIFILLAIYLWNPFAIATATIFLVLLALNSYDRLLLKYNIEVEPLTRNMLHAILDASFVKLLGEQLKQLTNDNLVMHRALTIQPYEFLAYFIAEYEKEMFPAKFDEVFGADFENDLVSMKKKAEQLENNKLKLLTDLANVDKIKRSLVKS